MLRSLFDNPGIRSRDSVPMQRNRSVAGVVPVGRMVASNRTACAVVEAVLCWPNGMSIDFAVFRRNEDKIPPVFTSPFEGPADADGLVAGIRYADGRIVTTVDDVDPDRRSVAGTIVATPGTATYGLGYLRQRVHLTPLPPTGPVIIAVRWNAVGLEEGHLTLNGDEIREGATRAWDVWES